MSACTLLRRVSQHSWKLAGLVAGLLVLAGAPEWAADNVLTEQECQDGWLLLFDGNTLSGWTLPSGKPSERPVEDHSINPHRCGEYMLV